jgi:hypothetical protein
MVNGKLHAMLTGLLLAASPPVGPAAGSSTIPADTLAALEHRYVLAEDGSAILETTVVLGAPGPAELLLPFDHTKADEFAIETGHAVFPSGMEGAVEPLRLAAGRPLLALAVDAEAAAGDTVHVRCRLPKAIDFTAALGPFGAYDVSRTLVNDSGVSIGRYRLEIVLPASFRFRRVTGSEPAFKPQAAPDPPYAVGHGNGRDVAGLTVNQFRPGNRAKLGVEAERVHRGPVPLVAGLVLAALYLVFFRSHIAAAPGQGAAPTQKESQS